MRELIAINEKHYRIGQDHHSAKITDTDVELIRQLHEDDGMTYKELALKFEVSVHTVVSICTYRRRVQHPAAWREKK